jgi:hypothetical protein
MPHSPKKTDAAAITVKPKRSRRASETQTKQTITPHEIARLAYAIYESRGRAEGGQLEDWLAAERQLLGRAEV